MDSLYSSLARFTRSQFALASAKLPASCALVHNFYLHVYHVFFLISFVHSLIYCAYIHLAPHVTSLPKTCMPVLVYFSKVERRSTNECVRCLKAYMNNKVSTVLA